MILCHLLIGQHFYPEKIKFYISGNAKGKAPIGGAYQAPITVALHKDAGKIRTNLLGGGGQTIFSWFMC